MKRRAAAAALVALSGTVMIGFASLAVDVGMLYNVRAELQRTADSAAMASAWELLDQRGRGASEEEAISEARAEAAAITGLNKVLNSSPTVDPNSGNAADGDVYLGYLSDPNNLQQAMNTGTPAQYNSVQVCVRRNSVRNGPIDLFFGQIFGISTTGLEAKATATFRDGVIGFHVTEKTGNAGIIPIALKEEYWKKLLAGTWTTGDHYTYDPDSKTVTAGSDGKLEMNLYPGSGANQAVPPGNLPPGNFGTLDIGSTDNSTAVISRQIREGLNASDLAYYGGEFKLSADGTLMLNGDTGLSAAISDDLEAIKGQPRTVPIFDQVSGPGENSMFRIIGFAGIRIVNVTLSGAMSGKNVMIQPAYVVDDSVIVSSTEQNHWFVFQPVQLTR